jgi:hypothetical protein
MSQKEHILDPNVYGLKPERAKEKLEDMGYTPNLWGKLLSDKLASHEVRALITIALGTEPQLLGEVYMNIREQDGLPRDRLVGRVK